MGVLKKETTSPLLPVREENMKKIISLLSLFSMLTLLTTPIQGEGVRGSGGIGGYSGRGGSGGPGGYRGSDRSHGPGGYRGPDRHNRPGGSRESDRRPGFRSHRGPDRNRDQGRHRGFGGFLPGLFVGGIIGWGLGPLYDYYPPPYYYPDLPEGDRPPESTGQGSGNRMLIYPRQGQNEEQQARDVDECHRWAVSQTDFDPEIPPEGPPDAWRREKSADYLRAISACLDARGYALKY